MKPEIDLQFKSNKWPKNAILKNKNKFSIFVLEALEVVKTTKLCKRLLLSLIFVSDAQIKKYNLKFKNKSSATNVLAFPTENFSKADLKKFKMENLFLGEIFFSFETIKKESEQQHKSFDAHLFHLFTHAFLHLIGYVHDSKETRDEMEELETSILKKFNIKNPYEIKP